jgi:hypothetical protein
VLAADACEANGLVVPQLGESTQRALRRLLPAGAATGNPVDITAVISAEVFGAAASCLREDPQVDAGTGGDRAHGPDRPLSRHRLRCSRSTSDRLDPRGAQDVIVRVGQLAELLPEVAEIDLNPMIIGPGGCVVVDARIRVAPAPAVGGDPALRALGI